MPPGDRFLGVPVPEIRKMVRESDALPIANVTSLVSSPLHEERLLGFLILVRRFERGEGPSQRQIYRTYLRQTRFLNGWDLVDVSAPNIVGTWLLSSPGGPVDSGQIGRFNQPLGATDRHRLHSDLH